MSVLEFVHVRNIESLDVGLEVAQLLERVDLGVVPEKEKERTGWVRMRPKFIGPPPRPTTKFRVVGPRLVNGMSVWTLHKILGPNSYSEPIGPPCFSFEEAHQRAAELARGKKVLWFGGVKFTRDPIQKNVTNRDLVEGKE